MEKSEEIIILNADKIINFLKEHKKPIPIKKLAEKTEINTKHIGKYLKILEDDKVIIRRPSEKDKRVKLIELSKRILYFFKFGNKYLLHTRTRLEKQDFKTYCSKMIKTINFPINIEIISTNILRFSNPNPEENEDNEYIIAPEPITKHKFQYFHIFDKNTLEVLETYFGYTVHVYSQKEIREMRKKKARTSLYSFITFYEGNVNLTLEKNGRKTLKTPFIYLDYFILRLSNMLRVKNTIKTMNRDRKIDNINDFFENQKTELIKREFKLTIKAFEYYRNIYNFSQIKTVYTNHRTKNKRELKEDKELMKIVEKNRNEYFKEISESINRQYQQHKLKQKEVKEREIKKFLGINKEPIDKILYS